MGIGCVLTCILQITKTTTWDHPFHKVTELTVKLPVVVDEPKQEPVAGASGAADAKTADLKEEQPSFGAKKPLNRGKSAPAMTETPVASETPSADGTGPTTPAEEDVPAEEPAPAPIDLSLLSRPSDAEMASLLRSWVDDVIGKPDPASATSVADDAVIRSCKDLLKAQYSTAKGEELLITMTSEPEWLTQLMRDPVWRPCLVDLARAAPKVCFVVMIAPISPVVVARV